MQKPSGVPLLIGQPSRSIGVAHVRCMVLQLTSKNGPPFQRDRPQKLLPIPVPLILIRVAISPRVGVRPVDLAVAFAQALSASEHQAAGDNGED